MRGTIAFALILRSVPPDGMRHQAETVMVTTVLGIVLTNCLVFGGAFPLALRLLGLHAGPAGLARRIRCKMAFQNSKMVVGRGDPRIPFVHAIF